MKVKVATSAQVAKGFHGTTQESAQEIVKTCFRLPGPNSGAYLGDGVYFFENQEGHARAWARTHCAKNVKGTSIAVIESDVRYGQLLNLTEPEQFETVQWFKAEYERKSQKSVTFATIIDIVAAQVKVEVVKACRIQSKPRLMSPGFSADVEIILAVRTLGNILSNKLIWSGMVGYS